MRGRIFSRDYQAHRIIWLWMTGRWPVVEIDHRNRNRADNRFKNLHEVTGNQQNQRNASRRNNKSGFTGVYMINGKYIAHIKVNKRLIYLGTFPTIEAAAAARQAANEKYGFSTGHGTPRSTPIGSKKQWATPHVWEAPQQVSLYGDIAPLYPTPLQHIRPAA